MKALRYHGKGNVSVDEVEEPTLVDPKDAILRVTSTAICGSDLHLFGGLIPTTEDGDILGHEFMGEIIAIGNDVQKLKIGDRVIVPFTISCGNCYFCEKGEFSLCDKSNPNKQMAEKVYGHSPAGMFGYSHMFGGFAGGQAEKVRVPYADVGAFKVPDNLSDEQVLFLTDIFPTGYMAAENCNIKKGDTVAIWGAGPVGQFAIRSAFMLGAGRVISIDRIPERLEMARQSGAETIDYEANEEVFDTLKAMTDGRGPDSCIDAVGMEAHGHGGANTIMNVLDKAKQAVRLETDRPTALRQVIHACRKGGTVSIAGVYGGFVDKFPIGIGFNKGLTFKMGQTHVHKYIPLLLEKIEKGEIDPSFVITHRLRLEDAPKAYEIFRNKEDGCIKVVLKP
ncbi:MAG: theronine dehydrogenase-like Zn-dependent dehydrogenase [Candidatus Taylorbacteria bacterium]|nr:theronine dehydrogenase-like Zn-dependent dehydrogenase [Candidatus Taylorbacteria bacterium]